MASTGVTVEAKSKEKGGGEEGEAEIRALNQTNGCASSFHARSLSTSTSSGATNPRSWQSSPRNFFGSLSSRSSNSCLAQSSNSSSSSSWVGVIEWLGFVTESKQRGGKRKTPKVWYRKRITGVVAMIGLLACFVVMNWWMLSRIQDSSHGLRYRFFSANSPTLPIREELKRLGKVKRPQKTIYAKLLAKAAHALAEGQNKPEPRELWEEPFFLASSWRPCADQRNWDPSEGNNGYILVSANGGINQQRVAVCNAVAVARLLNATLVVPKFLYSSVWRDPRRRFLSTT